ncbi:MAG: hypothetical protein HY904_20490 [Deltaproteobacteria bacterium]|nr:hypothetical protein [Deltaproteobacteria bacterium]
MRRILWLLLLAAGPAAAQQGSAVNTCDDVGGIGSTCTSNTDCAGKAYATSCVQTGTTAARTCQVPCNTTGSSSGIIPHQATCALGEKCVTPAAGDNYCRATAFRMDLNLFDQCVNMHLAGAAPALGSLSECSLEANLARLLDQDRDGDFDVFDFDLCIQAFVTQPDCDETTGTCPAEDLVFCTADTDCGDGLYCSTEHHFCTRECGMISSREPGIPELERRCSGRLKICDPDRGKCVPVTGTTTCGVDRDCAEGAYCFLGQCAPKCGRSLDCPDSNWFCTENGRCRVLPPPGDSGATPFDPRNYSLLFSNNQLTLTPVELQQSAPILVMDLRSKREVRDDPSVAFGYRLEVTYGLKDEAKCRKAPDRWTDAERADCVIAPEEEFVVPLSPFGTVYAQGQPGIAVRLNTVAADTLTPGTYAADANVIFDNGSQDRFAVRLQKTTASGEYAGTLAIAMGSAANSLTGATPLLLSMQLDLKDSTVHWNDLLAAEGLGTAQTLVDTTEGTLIHGRLHGNEALPYALPTATDPAHNEIPLKGIYSARYGIMRLVGVIEIPAGFCVSQRGSCETFPDDLRAENLFGRPLRRVLQFFGTFDETKRRFFGIYRETIYGLTPAGELTLDGSFLLSQRTADETPVDLADALLAAGSPAVAFPSGDAVLSGVDADIAAHCKVPRTALADGGKADAGAGQAEFVRAFATPDAYQQYLETSSSSDGGVPFPVLENTLTFKDLIQQGLDNLTTDATRGNAVITIYDFLAGRIVLCGDGEFTPGAPLGTQAPACVSAAQLQCGLALYRKAVLKRYVPLNSIAADSRLFCSGTLPTSGCGQPPTQYPALRTLQEHNRFHQELSQATKFQADRDVSDAFFALYRNQFNPFTQGQTLQFKADQLKAAAGLYDQAIRLVVEPAAAAVLFSWPMGSFEGLGREWIRQMHVLATDRSSALAELVDLRRRLFLSAGAGDQLVAEHLAQQEFLLQVYLMALQRQWEGPAFAYAGQAAQAFDRMQVLLRRLNQSRNVLGMIPDRVFFESSDAQQPNWRNYLTLLTGADGSGGLLALARTQTGSAVDNLQAALRDADALESQVFAINDQLEGDLTDLCGTEQPKSCDTLRALMQKDLAALLAPDSAITAAERSQLQASGATASVLAGILDRRLQSECGSTGGTECQSAVTKFKGLVATEPACDLDAARSYVRVRGQPRACVGGEMGDLLKERRGLLLEREAMFRELQNLIARVKTFQETYRYTQDLAIGQRVTMITAAAVKFALLVSEKGTKTAAEIADELADTADCVLIAGLAVGTNCPGKIGRTAGRVSIAVSRTFAEAALEALKEQVDTAREIADFELEQAQGRAEAAASLKELLGEFDGFVDGYRGNLQAVFDVETGMEQVRFLADDAMGGANDNLSLVVDHLVGRESGSVLVGNHLVRESAKTYRRVLDAAYRMTMAFSHRYNLPTATRTQLSNRVQQAVTLEDVQSHIDDLVERARTYCATEAIDCDAFNNLSTLRFSLRDELFPQLRDVVDPATGRVFTRGQQFHNLITSPPYLRRRVRGAWLVDQVEIPFAISTAMRDNIPPRRWLLSPLECNHVLDGDPAQAADNGTVAVNALVRNVDGTQRTLEYELGRGHLDQARSCHAESVQDEPGTLPVVTYPIQTTVVGYAPESLEGQQDAPRTYFARSGELQACLNRAETGGRLEGSGCWRFFARDRTLAAPDYTLYIPLRIDDAETGNSWITGDGLPDASKPVIEDIVVYLRYRTRPIGDAQ